MNLNIDDMLGASQQQRSDRRLDQLEPLVWARIAQRRRAASIVGLWGWRAALVSIIAAAGAFAGAAAVPSQKSDFSPFAIRAQLAPSSLLAGGA